MPTRRILLDNAYISWQMAIKYCDAILAGRSTLLNRKFFVSNLQNAIELFIKQIMLDNTDYRVSEIKNCAIDGIPAKDYYTSTNLNDYFESLPKKQLNKFRSIEFRKLIEIHKEILNDYLGDEHTLKPQLSLLTKLRNSETHFNIESEQFLLENEFAYLYNFMIDFYGIMKYYNLLPYWGKSPSEYKHLEFKRQVISDFSYVEAAKRSELVKKLACIANESTFETFPGETAYSITDAIISCSNTDFNNQFNEAWEYIQVLDEYGLIQIETTEYEVENYNLDCHLEEIRIEQSFFINVKI